MQQRKIKHPEELEAFFPRLAGAGAIALGTQAVGLGGADGHGRSPAFINLAWGEGQELEIDCAGFLPAGLETLQKIFALPAVKVFADAARDLPLFLGLGLTPPAPLFDVALVTRLLEIADMPDASEEAQPYGPATLAPDNDESLPELLRRREALIPPLVRNGLVQVTDIELRCLPAVAHMHCKGIYLDLEKWRQLTALVKKERDLVLERLAPWLGGPAVRPSLWGEDVPFGHNLDSNAQVLKLLHRHGVKAASTSRRDLAPHQDHPLVRELGAYRKASKALSSFLLPYPELVCPASGRLYPRYEQLTAYSGRMSCHQPNIQQIPREKAFRECFTAPPGRSLVLADYSQIELRVAAQIAGDQRMLAAYQAGEDLHLLTASHLAGKPMALVSKQERQAYKAVNLGLIYGMGAEGLRETAKQSYGVDMPFEQAGLFRRRFFETYQGIRAWHQRIREEAAREGRTLTGRRFPFSPQAGLPERSNLPVQGTAADIIKKALGLLVSRLDPDTWIVAVVHDEILLECPAGRATRAAALLGACMEEAAVAILPDVPTSVEAVISSSWAEK